jgi:hypothetical protein
LKIISELERHDIFLRQTTNRMKVTTDYAITIWDTSIEQCLHHQFFENKPFGLGGCRP